MNSSPLTEKQLHYILQLLAEEKTFALFETTRTNPENYTSYLFTKPRERLTCKGGDDPQVFFEKLQNRLEQGLYVAGWFTYEFGYLLEPVFAPFLENDRERILADFQVYGEPLTIDHDTGRFSHPPEAKGEHLSGYRLDNLRLNEDERKYVESIGAIKKYIEDGDTYQVNYTLKLLFEMTGSTRALYQDLRRNQSVSYSAFIKSGGKEVLSFSPELFFRKSGDFCKVRPMKGTMRRGLTSAEDAAMARTLREDMKNRSENVMIVDLLRNDLGRLCEMGSVKVSSLFDIETYETLHQMTSTVEGALRREVGLADIFQAIYPCGSVTGAPKIRTMEIIHELESEQRGVYTGGIGFFTPGGDAVFNVPIRTVVVENGRGEMGIGSGVVYDSDPHKEWDECRLKGNFLSDPAPAFGLIETMLWRPDQGYWLLEYHLERLQRAAEYFTYCRDLDKIRAGLAEAAENFKKDRGRRVRLLLNKDASFEITSVECDLPENPYDCPIESGQVPKPIKLSARRIDPASPFLYYKTTIRELYDRERQQAVEEGFYEVIFANERDEITEGAITNIFIRQGDRLYTSPVACGLLDGVFRRSLLEKNQVEQRILTRKDLENAEAIFVGNSVRGLVRVRLE